MDNQDTLAEQLRAAVEYGRLKLFRKLLQKATAGDVNQQDENGETPLTIAAMEGNTEMVKMLLLIPGIDVNIQNNNGSTALMLASSYDHTGVAKLLLALLRIDVTLEHQSGYKARYFAKSKAMKKLFRAHGQFLRSNATQANNSPANAVSAAAPVASEIDASPTSWLAARLLRSGYDATTVTQCEQKLVVQEGFVLESDFASCLPSEFNRYYLCSIGITGLGMQKHLLRVQSELHQQHTTANCSVSTKADSSQDLCIVEKHGVLHYMGFCVILAAIFLLALY